MPNADIATTYQRWTFMRAVFHRGWWLVTSLYLVVVADLSASQLALYGAVLAITGLLAEVPTGVMADAISRKWSLVIAHLVLGAGMVLMGFVTTFPLILVSQVLWGLGWTFASGADVAWLTDELDRPDRTAGVLITAARWEQVGAACGLVIFGALAWGTDLATAVVIAGSGMALLGPAVAARFTERNFTRTREHRLRASTSIFRRGFALARGDRQLLVVFAATLLVNAGAETGFLFPKRLLALGFPQQPEPIVWFTALGLATLGLGALALRIVQARIDSEGVAPRVYAAASVVGALALVVLAGAPDEVTGMAGVLIFGGTAEPVTRAVSVIWVNRRTTSDVRATVHSFLAQAESAGEILGGVAFAILARATGIPVVLVLAAALVWVAGALVFRSRNDRSAPAVEQLAR